MNLMNKLSFANFAKKKILLMVLLVVALAGTGWWIWYQKQPHYREIKVYTPTIKEVHITGEVVDAWCYASQTMGPGRGIGHLTCATACIGGGVTPGILEDKTEILYVAAKYKGYLGCRELLFPFIGKKVVVDGWVGDMGGNRMLRINSVKLAEPEAPAVQAVVPVTQPVTQSNSKTTSDMKAMPNCTMDESLKP